MGEIHDHPVRPAGFAEPLFLSRSDRKEIAEHLAGSVWLAKASCGARVVRSPCHVYRSAARGGVWLARPGCRRRKRRAGKRRVTRVIGRWREVSGWWRDGGGEDLLLYRLLLSGGSVVDVARDRRTGGWELVRVLD